MKRRRLLQAAIALLASGPLALRTQQRVPIADMYSHYGMVTRRIAGSGLAEDMRSQRVALVAWKLVADGRWIRATRTGIEQSGEPAPGDLAEFFDLVLGQMKAYIAEHKLRAVLTRADVDACLAGDAGIVFVSKGADFLEGKVDRLDAAYANGPRHLQLVHYIHTPVGDFQTVAPVHNGLSAMGKAPLVWSHGWVEGDGGSWQDQYGFLKRRLSLAHAKKFAARGGVIGLWALGLSRPGLGWSVGPRGMQAYALEIADLVDKIGADHVPFGTDIEGVAYANYARVLKAALKA